jgi:hypothetical protein
MIAFITTGNNPHFQSFAAWERQDTLDKVRLRFDRLAGLLYVMWKTPSQSSAAASIADQINMDELSEVLSRHDPLLSC